MSVLARCVPTDEIGANPRLALLGFILRVLVDDLVDGLQRGRFTEQGEFVPAGDMPAARQRDIQCAIDAVRDGRLDLFCDWLHQLGGVSLTPAFLIRRAIALAANPSAFSAPYWLMKRRDADRRSRAYHATSDDPPDRRGLNADLNYSHR